MADVVAPTMKCCLLVALVAMAMRLSTAKRSTYNRITDDLVVPLVVRPHDRKASNAGETIRCTQIGSPCDGLAHSVCVSAFDAVDMRSSTLLRRSNASQDMEAAASDVRAVKLRDLVGLTAGQQEGYEEGPEERRIPYRGEEADKRRESQDDDTPPEYGTYPEDSEREEELDRDRYQLPDYRSTDYPYRERHPADERREDDELRHFSDENEHMGGRTPPPDWDEPPEDGASAYPDPEDVDNDEPHATGSGYGHGHVKKFPTTEKHFHVKKLIQTTKHIHRHKYTKSHSVKRTKSFKKHRVHKHIHLVYRHHVHKHVHPHHLHQHLRRHTHHFRQEAYTHIHPKYQVIHYTHKHPTYKRKFFKKHLKTYSKGHYKKVHPPVHLKPLYKKGHYSGHHSHPAPLYSKPLPESSQSIGTWSQLAPASTTVVERNTSAKPRGVCVCAPSFQVSGEQCQCPRRRRVVGGRCL